MERMSRAVGNDVTEDPWIDEGLATYAQLRYLAYARGEQAAATQRRRWESSTAQTAWATSGEGQCFTGHLCSS